MAAFTGLTSGGVTKMIDRLEEDGLVTRTTGLVSRDRRAVVVQLTEKGEALAKALAEAVMDQMSLVRSLSAEMTTLIDIIDGQLDSRPTKDGVGRRRPRA